MKSNFATRAKAIEAMKGVDSGTTRKLLRDLYAEQQKFADGGLLGDQPKTNPIGGVDAISKGPSTIDFVNAHGNMDLNNQQRTYLNQSMARDEINESGAYKQWQDKVLQLQAQKAATGFTDTTKYPVAPPRFGQQPARAQMPEVSFANGGKVSLQKEIKNGVEVEREHAPTLEFVKNYFAQTGQFPTVDKFAKSIMSDHEGDFKNLSDNPQQSYYQRLIDNNLTDEKSKYAFGGNIKPVNLTDADIAGIRMMADGGSIFDHPLIQQLAQQRLQQKYGSKEELPQIVQPQNGQQVTESTPPPSVPQSAYAPTQQRVDNAVSQTNTMPPNVPYLEYIKKYFPEKEWSNAARVMMGESAGNAKAFRGEKRNPGGGNDSGLFQFNSKYHPEVYSGGDVFNPEYNIKSAAQLHSKQGWKPWVAAKKYNIGADGGNLYPIGGGLSARDPRTTTDRWVDSAINNAPQIAPAGDALKGFGNIFPPTALLNYLTGSVNGPDAYTAAMPVLGATGKAAGIVEEAMNKGYAAKAAYAAKKARQATQPAATIPKYSGNAPTLQSSQFAAQDADNARKFMAAGIVGGAGTLAYNAKVNGLSGVQTPSVAGVTTPTPFQIPNMNYSTQDNPNYYDSKSGPQNTADVGVYAERPVRPGNLSPLQPRRTVLPVNLDGKLAPTPDFTQLHENPTGGGFDYNNLMRMAPVFANMIPGRKPSNIPNDLTLPRVNAQKFAPDYLSTAPVTEQLGAQYRTGVDALSSVTGGSASAMRSGLQGLNRSAGRSAGEALTDIYGKNTGLKNSATQYNLENVNKANMFNAEMGAKEALSRKEMDITNKELSQGYTNQEQQRRAAAFTQLGQIGKENVQNKLAERIYGYSADGTKITDPKKIHQVVYKNNPKTSKSKLPVVKSAPAAKYVNRPEQDIASMRMNYNGQ